MAHQYAYAAITAFVVACGVAAVEPAHAQLRDGGLLPHDQSGLVTAVGCFVRGGEDNEDYLLAHPKQGPVNSVQEETCTASGSADALKLDNTKKSGMNDSMLGHWIEINGRLEKESSDDPDNLRELDVLSFRILPIVPRRAAAAPPAPAYQPAAPVLEQPIARAPEAPVVGTSGELPKTASPMPFVGLIGALFLAGGLGLRSLRSRI
jgi:hypothetical protein